MAKREPNILIVTGDEDFIRRRTVREIVAAKAADGWRTDQVDGADSAQLDAVLGSGGMFLQVSKRSLVVVENPEKADLEIYKAHADDEETDIILLLHYEGNPAGNTKFGKWVATQKANVKECKTPAKKWEIPEKYAAFCVQEAKKRGLTLDGGLAGAIVERAGANLGVLSFEILKLVMLAQAEGVTVITPDNVKASLAVLLEAEVQPVIVALSGRNQKRLSTTLERLRQTTRDDATIPVCRSLSSSVLRWFSVADLREQGKSPDEAALLLGQNPWFYRNKLLPQVSRWSRRDLLELFRALAISERKALSGAVNPWVGLVGRLLSVCRSE